MQELQSSNDSLLLSNEQLTSSNLLLQSNVESLTASNALLQTSLTASREDLAISEAEQRRLGTDLQDCTQSIIAAREEAKKVQMKVTLLQVGVVTLGITTAAGIFYVVGDQLKWW